MIKLYKKYLPLFKHQVILGPCFKLLEAIFELLVPLIMARIIDVGIQNKDTNYIIKMGIILFALAIVGLSSTLVCQFFACHASQGVGTNLRNDLYKHINKFSMNEIDEFRVSSLMTRMNNDINQVQTSVAMLIRLVVRAPFIVIGATIMSFTISPKLSIIFISSGILIFILIFVIMKICIPLNKKVQVDLDEETVITKENLTGTRVIRAFDKQEYEIKRFNKSTDKLCRDATKQGKINALLNPFTTIIINVAIILVIYFSSFSVNTGSMTKGDVTALTNYLSQILVAIVVVANLVVTFTKAQASSLRINEVFETTCTINNGTIKTISDSQTSLEFKNVSFKYPSSSNNAVNNINFSIKSNEFIGIIGSTGSGKTTLINLINRLYYPTFGEIIFFNNNLKEYENKVLRENIVTVLQKNVLFHMSIRDNILFGSNHSDEEIIEALKLSQAYDFVFKLKNNLDSMVLEGGKNFSGGERQRLCIARAILRKPKILILDDSSSALDYKTDKSLREALKTLKCTVIIISQRISSIEDCDRIMVLNDGLIESFDSHNNLLTHSKIYNEILESQGGNK